MLAEDHRLFDAVERNDAKAAIQQAIRDGAIVNAVQNGWTPLITACGRRRQYVQVVRILMDAEADARWRDRHGWSAMLEACENGHLSTVQLLINHDNGLLEMADKYGCTPLFAAIHQQNSDLVRLLLDSDADPHHVDQEGETALMIDDCVPKQS